jgi:cation diffusion facilitator family transporter
VLTQWLVRTFVSRPEQVDDPQVRKAYGVLEGWVSIATNLVVSAVKLASGVMIGSIALIADGVHSFGDVLSSGVVIWGFEASAKPSDREHPFGHGRVETIATLVIGIMLFVVAWEFAQNSVIRLFSPKPVAASTGLLAVLGVTVVLKVWLTRFARTLARAIASPALEGDSWHHRSDVFATLVVIGSLIAARSGLHVVDALGGLAVSGFIAVAGYRLTRDAVSPLVGEAPPLELLREIRETARAVPAVDEVHDVIVHSYGGLLVTSLHAEVTSDLDVNRAHEVAEAVETALNDRFGGWSVVHIDPVNRAHPLYAEVDSFLHETVPAIGDGVGFHDLRIVGGESPCFVIFDLEADAEHARVVATRLRGAVAAHFPQVAKVVVNIEPGFVY